MAQRHGREPQRTNRKGREGSTAKDAKKVKGSDLADGVGSVAGRDDDVGSAASLAEFWKGPAASLAEFWKGPAASLTAFKLKARRLVWGPRPAWPHLN